MSSATDLFQEERESDASFGVFHLSGVQRPTKKDISDLDKRTGHHSLESQHPSVSGMEVIKYLLFPRPIYFLKTKKAPTDYYCIYIKAPQEG